MTTSGATRLSLEINLCETTLESGDAKLALTHADRVKTRLAAGEDALWFRVEALRGCALLALDQFQAAEASLVAAMGLAERPNIDQALVTRVVASLGHVLAARGENAEAQPHLSRARAAHEAWLEAQGSRADTSFAPWDYKDGGPLPPPYYARCLIDLAVIDTANDRVQEARDGMAIANDVLEKQFDAGYDATSSVGTREAYRVAHFEHARLFVEEALAASREGDQKAAVTSLKMAIRTLQLLRESFARYPIKVLLLERLAQLASRLDAPDLGEHVKELADGE